MLPPNRGHGGWCRAFDHLGWRKRSVSVRVGRLISVGDLRQWWHDDGTVQANGSIAAHSVISQETVIHAAMRQSLKEQIRRLGPTFVVLYPPTLALLLAVVVAANRLDQPVSVFLSDPITTMDGPPYYGVVSNLGILLWGSSGAVAWFSGVLMRKSHGRSALTDFLIASAYLTTLLVTDDLFLLHEEILPKYLHVPQNLVLASYVLLGGG